MKFIRARFSGFLFLVMVFPVQAQYQPYIHYRGPAYQNVQVLPVSAGSATYIVTYTRVENSRLQLPVGTKLVCTTNEVHSSRHGAYTEQVCTIVTE